MANESDKKYIQNGKVIRIVPVKRRRAEEGGSLDDQPEEKRKPVKGQARFAVGDKVSLKNIPAELAGSGFVESVITKVFKSTHDQQFRYSIRSNIGRELPLVKEEQLKLRKTNFSK